MSKETPETLFDLIVHQLTAVSTNKYRRQQSKLEEVSDEILEAILSGCLTTKQLVERTGYSLSAVAKHVRLIEQRKLIRVVITRRNGPMRIIPLVSKDSDD